MSIQDRVKLLLLDTVISPFDKQLQSEVNDTSGEASGNRDIIYNIKLYIVFMRRLLVGLQSTCRVKLSLLVPADVVTTAVYSPDCSRSNCEMANIYDFVVAYKLVILSAFLSRGLPLKNQLILLLSGTGFPKSIKGTVISPLL